MSPGYWIVKCTITVLATGFKHECFDMTLIYVYVLLVLLKWLCFSLPNK